MAPVARTFAAIVAAASAAAGADILVQFTAEHVAQLPRATVATLQLHRRLANHEGMGIPAACLAKCPSLESRKADMEIMAKETSTDTDPTKLASMFETVMVKMAELMCKHKAEFKCMADNQAVCVISDELGMPDSNPMNTIATNLDCMCDKCPNIAGAYGRMYGTILGDFVEAMQHLMLGTEPPKLSDEEVAAAELKTLNGLCPMVSMMPCIKKESTCSKVFGQVGGSGIMANTFTMELETKPTAFGETCKAKGVSTEYKTPNSAGTASEAAHPSAVSKPLAALVGGLAAACMLGQWAES